MQNEKHANKKSSSKMDLEEEKYAGSGACSEFSVKKGFL